MYRLSYGTDPNQFGHLRIPAGDGPHPLVIVIHGGFWRSRYDLSHMEPLCVQLAAEGLATWSLEYRRIGQPGGAWPGTLDDVLAGVSYRSKLAADYQLDADGAVLVGYSAGGHLALCAASHDAGLRGVVSLAGVADLQLAWDMRLSDGVVQEFLGGVPSEYPLASPMNLPISVPQRLVHGDEDESVPVEIARQYVRTKRKLGEVVELQELAGMKHAELIDPESAAWPAVKEAILSLLSRSN